MCSACDQEFANNRNSTRPEDLFQYDTVIVLMKLQKIIQHLKLHVNVQQLIKQVNLQHNKTCNI